MKFYNTRLLELHERHLNLSDVHATGTNRHPMAVNHECHTYT